MKDGRSFCAIVLGDEIQRLIIPPPFVEEHGAFFPARVALQTDGESGVSWPVAVAKAGGRYYLTDGWREFIKDNALECANFLLLRFVEDSRIVVSVFNRNGLKRKTAAFRFTWRDFKKNCTLINGRVCKALRLRDDAKHVKLRNMEGCIIQVKLFKTDEDKDGRVGFGDGWALFVDLSNLVEEQTYQFECMRCDKKIQMQLSLVDKE